MGTDPILQLLTYISENVTNPLGYRFVQHDGNLYLRVEDGISNPGFVINGTDLEYHGVDKDLTRVNRNVIERVA
jgi:hypothetical protein